MNLLAQERYDGFSRPDEMNGYAFIPRSLSLLHTDIMIPVAPESSRYVLFGSGYEPASWRTYLKMPVDSATPPAIDGIAPSLFEKDLQAVRSFVSTNAEDIKEIALASGMIGYQKLLRSM